MFFLPVAVIYNVDMTKLREGCAVYVLLLLISYPLKWFESHENFKKWCSKYNFTKSQYFSFDPKNIGKVLVFNIDVLNVYNKHDVLFFPQKKCQSHEIISVIWHIRVQVRDYQCGIINLILGSTDIFLDSEEFFKNKRTSSVKFYLFLPLELFLSKCFFTKMP